MESGEPLSNSLLRRIIESFYGKDDELEAAVACLIYLRHITKSKNETHRMPDQKIIGELKETARESLRKFAESIALDIIEEASKKDDLNNKKEHYKKCVYLLICNSK